MTAKSIWKGCDGEIVSCTNRGYRVVINDPYRDRQGSGPAVLFQAEELEIKKESNA